MNARVKLTRIGMHLSPTKVYMVLFMTSRLVSKLILLRQRASLCPDNEVVDNSMKVEVKIDVEREFRYRESDTVQILGEGDLLKTIKIFGIFYEALVRMKFIAMRRVMRVKNVPKSARSSLSQ